MNAASMFSISGVFSFWALGTNKGERMPEGSAGERGYSVGTSILNKPSEAASLLVLYGE